MGLGAEIEAGDRQRPLQTNYNQCLQGARWIMEAGGEGVRGGVGGGFEAGVQGRVPEPPATMSFLATFAITRGLPSF